MTDESFLELRRAVERIVRPIDAGWRRKLAMREELFCHVVAAYDDESASHTGEAAAVNAAIQRLGEASTVRRDLQASVPALERASQRKVGGAPGTWSGWGLRLPCETQFHHIARVASMHGILCAVAGAVWIAVVALASDRGNGVTWSFAQAGSAVAGFAILGALYVALVHRLGPGLLDRLNRAGATARSVYTLLGAALILIPSVLTTGPLVILLLARLPWQSVFVQACVLIGITGLLPAIFGYQFHPAGVTEWERLELGD